MRDGTAPMYSRCSPTLPCSLETSIATIPTGATKKPTPTETSYKTGLHFLISSSSTTRSNEAPSIPQDGSETTRLISAGYRWLMVIINLPPAQSWMTFPTANIAHPQSILVLDSR